MKKVIVIADVIMSLLAVGIIYADLRFFAIPKWIGLLSMAVLLALIVWEWIKEKRLWGKVIFTVINIVVLFVVFVGTYCNPYRNSIWFYANPDYACQEYGTELTYDEAKADLDQAMKYLKNDHPLFIHGLTADVQDLYEQALAHLQEKENISINDLSREIEMIFSSLGDGHTHVGANYPEYHYLKYIYGHNLAKDELVADEFIHYLDVDSYQTWGQDWRLGLLMIFNFPKNPVTVPDTQDPSNRTPVPRRQEAPFATVRTWKDPVWIQLSATSCTRSGLRMT